MADQTVMRRVRTSERWFDFAYTKSFKIHILIFEPLNFVSVKVQAICSLGSVSACATPRLY